MESGLSSVRSFLYKRAARIYPLWWIFATIMGVYFFITYRMWGAPDLPDLTPPATDYFIKSLFLIPQNNFPVLGLGWSLIHEMQFYFIFAFFLFAPRRWLPMLLAIWAGLNLTGYFLGWANYGALQKILFSLLSLEFIVGAGVALLILKRVIVAPKAIFIGGLIASIIALIAYTDKSRALTSWGRMAVYTVPFAAVIYGAAALEQAGRLSAPRWLTSIGDWSYSLSLSHYIVLIVIIRLSREAKPHLPDVLINKLSLGAPGMLDNLVFTVVAIILSIITAAICYNLIERPLLKAMRRRNSRDKQKDIL